MRFVASLAFAALALTAAPPSTAAAEAKFPDHMVKIIVPFAAGGGVDQAARLLANQLREQLGVAVIVDNRPGASGTLGGKVVQTSPADGYTLLFSAATHVMAKHVMSEAPYDPQADFAPVARVGEAPLMLVVSPQRGTQKLGALVADAKGKPEKWTAAIPAAGAPSHLATLLLAKQADVRFTFVPYKGTQPALTDVAGGHTDLLLDSMISLLPLATAGKVRPIAVTSKKRSTLAPDVPTVAESGFPNVSYVSWYGVWAPKGTSAERVQMMNRHINVAVAVLAKSGAWAKLGIDPVSESVEQFQKFIATDVTQGAELLKLAGFKPE